MGNKQSSGPTNSGDVDNQLIENLLSQLKDSAEKFAVSMGQLIAKKTNDEQEETCLLQPLEKDKQEFAIQLAALIKMITESKDRDALIVEIGGIQEMYVILGVIQSVLKQVNEYRGEERDKMRRNDQDIEWIKDSIYRLRKVGYQVIDKGYNKPRPF